MVYSLFSKIGQVPRGPEVELTSFSGNDAIFFEQVGSLFLFFFPTWAALNGRD